MDYKLAWAHTLKEIESLLDSLAFTTWFSNIDIIDIKDNSVRVSIPMPWYQKHIDANYKSIILEHMNKLLTNPVDNIIYILQSDVKDILEEENKMQDTSFINNSVDNVVKVSSISNNFKSNLNPNYTFESFVVGESNKFAQAAALAVSENPGTMYNPLFIYGNSGLGKTHLMHAIGNYIVSKHNKKVLYVTCDQFVEDFINLSRKNNKDNNLDYVAFFKDKYRNIDVLIIDDIQFLAGATASQQEFFYTFNNLHNDKKQIIVSSDRSPEDLKVLEDRLRTRFCWGLQVDINPPDLNLKIAIIQKKLKGEKLEIPFDVVTYIASNVGNDIRQIEGSINRLIAYSAIMCRNNITVEFAMEALKDFTRKPVTDQNNIRRIQKGVANFYKVSFDDLKSKKRLQSLVIPRQVAMYLCRKLTDEPFERIGLEFGGKNHATVIHACNKMEKQLNENKELRDALTNIEKELT